MIKFIIDHIDPLGQGVFKKGEDIYFIPKTLPGEEGHLKVLKKSKGVHFCELINLTKKSPLRTEPTCPHFNQCNGCDYLHTSYTNEIEFKVANYRRLLKSLNQEETKIEVIESPKRLGYRNRIQLHYHKKIKKLGFKKYKSSQIVDIPECKIMLPEVQSTYEKLKSTWTRQANKPFGHVEIYQQDNDVLVSWNKKYAQGGFTQVNGEVNEKLQKLIESKIINNDNVLDLFGGNGNLTRSLKNKTLRIDLYNDEGRDSKRFHLNLFEDDALSSFQSHNKEEFKTFIVDPPRSGFKNLDLWANAYTPNNIIYVSCHPPTMVRDIQKIMNYYKVESSHLIDLFPSTHHYEAMISLTRI